MYLIIYNSNLACKFKMEPMHPNLCLKKKKETSLNLKSVEKLLMLLHNWFWTLHSFVQGDTLNIGIQYTNGA